MAYSYSQLERLWISAGGAKSLAPIMAAIAMAESGGNPNAENPSGATGLWQILGAVHPADASRLTDPSVNAKEAVAKYHTQGLKAWTTYTSGAYKKFLQGNVPAKPPVTGGQAFVDEAEKFFGTPYVWGGESPKGFDCSGLVQYVAQKLGLKNMPRTSEAQWSYVQHIPRSKLKPGDLVFYAGSDGTASSPGHVAIYIGNGQIVQALETGTNVGKFPLDSAGKPVGYGRIPGINQASVAGGSGSFPGPGGSSGGTDFSGWLSDLTQGLKDGWDALTGNGPVMATPSGVVGGTSAGLVGIAETLFSVEQHIAWFFVPSHWVRIFSGVAGSLLVVTGIIVMTRTGRGYSVEVPVAGAVPAPGGQLAPALGVAEVTLGAVLLFVAFHNLPPTVSDFPGLLSYLQGQVQSGGQAALWPLAKNSCQPPGPAPSRCSGASLFLPHGPVPPRGVRRARARGHHQAGPHLQAVLEAPRAAAPRPARPRRVLLPAGVPRAWRGPPAGRSAPGGSSQGRSSATTRGSSWRSSSPLSCWSPLHRSRCGRTRRGCPRTSPGT
jgi:cell wall-associated NlpC family hydrolase